MGVVTKCCDIFTALQSTVIAHMIMMSVDLQCSVFRIGWDVDNKEEFQTMLLLLMLVTNVDGVTLLLALVLVELQNTCKKNEQKNACNICYIFEKLRVQECQIGHSHVSIPFNSTPQYKKALYVIISGKFLKIRFLANAHF